MEKTRISKLMAERGLCSRREADSYIERGWVRVDGVVVAELGSKFEEQSGLANLPGTGKYLDASRSGFAEPLSQSLSAMRVCIFYGNHSRIIIRLQQEECQGHYS